MFADSDTASYKVESVNTNAIVEFGYVPLQMTGNIHIDFILLCVGLLY